jgi:hypothetical protein
VRRACAGVAAVIAVVSLFGAIWVLGDATIDPPNGQRAKDRKIEQMFETGRAFVSDFATKTGRLPTTAEFDAWSSQHTSGPYSVSHLSFAVGPFPEQFVSSFRLGRPTQMDMAYVLEYWRGEWTEYYLSWAGRSTIEPSNLVWALNMGGPFLCIGLVLGCIAIWLLRSLKLERGLPPDNWPEKEQIHAADHG